LPVYAVFDFSVWNNPLCSRQCHGDATCEGIGIGSLKKWVYVDDLEILAAIYNLPNDYPDIYYNPQVDFNRDFKIDDADYAIIEEWFGLIGVPNDCGKKLELNFYKDYVPAGSTQLINWTWRYYTDYIPSPSDEDNPHSLALYFWEINSGLVLIGTNTGTDPFEWQVPDIDSSQCLLILKDLDHPGLEDASELYFTIYQCQYAPMMDTDHDCVITFIDFASLAANWKIEPDGKIIEDLAILANNWLACGNPYDPDRCE